MVRKLIEKIRNSQGYLHAMKWYDEKAHKHVHNFLMAGPALIGWIYGLLRYAPHEKEFAVALRSLQIFLLYVAILAINSLLAFLDFFSYSRIEIYFESVAALAYLAVHAVFWLKYTKGEEMVLPGEQKFQAGMQAFIAGK